MSIGEYFKKQYNYTLKYPNLPCIWVSPKEKNTYIPMEVRVVTYLAFLAFLLILLLTTMIPLNDMFVVPSNPVPS